MGLSYAWEKFHLASLSLVADRPIGQRIVDAIVTLNTLTTGNHLGGEMAKEFNQLMADITKMPAIGDEGTIQATVDSMSNEELEEVAERIIGLYDDVARAYGDR